MEQGIITMEVETTENPQASQFDPIDLIGIRFGESVPLENKRTWILDLARSV